ncbi:MAG: hypothetical protein AAFQ58_10040 [Pseudomonadota bacterium]
MSPELNILRGHVVAIGSRMTGGRIARGAQQAELHATPEIWLKDEDDKEHHLRGWEFDSARNGHALIVVLMKGSGELVQIRNLSAKTVTDGPALNKTKIGGQTSFGSFVSLALLLFIPAFFGWLLVVAFMSAALGIRSNGLNIGLQIQIFVPIWTVFCLFANSKWVASEHAKGRKIESALQEALSGQGLD